MDHRPEPLDSELPAPLPAARSDGAGCLNTALLIVMFGGILTLTVIILSVVWVVEQTLFTSPIGAADLRWLISLGYAAAILIPAAIIWAAGRTLAGRRYFYAIGMAGLYALCLVPAHLPRIDAALETAALQMGGSALFLLITWLDTRRRHIAGNARGWGLALLLAGVLSYPWLLWGAFGSAWDIVLNLLAALMFGFSAARVVQVAFQREVDRPDSLMDILLNGLIAALILLVMVVGLGANGNQGLLVLAVAPLGWALAVLSDRSRRSDGRLFENTLTLALLAGLAAFWPLALIDPDELAAVITLGVGELIQWANLAAVAGLGIGVTGTVILLILRSGTARLSRRSPRVVLIIAGLVWLGALGLYLGLGQPGLYGERLFVILKDQADLSQVSQIADYNQRRSAVYQALVQKADSSQAGIRQQLDRYRIPYQPYYLENAIEVQAGPLVRWWLESQPEVDRVLNSPILRPLPAPVPVSQGGESVPLSTPWNLQMIGADRVWSELGVTGKGVIVGQSDSGAWGDHNELSASYRGRGGQDDYNWLDPWNHSPSPTDIGGHGTHTLGTIVGKRVGVAPGAQWIGCVNLARNLGNPAVYLDCMQFMLAPFPRSGDPLHDGRPEMGAMVLNNSWGCPPVEGCDPNALLVAVTALRAAGVFVVASAGNDGERGCGSVSDPIALYGQVYSVGAVDSSGELTSFSSIGPVEVDGSQRVKPDIVAPGQDILSSFPGGTYSSLAGTSMAGPHVVGVVALMWSANPALIGDIDRTIQILDETATPYNGSLPACVSPGYPNSASGYGQVDAYSAVQRALALK